MMIESVTQRCSGGCGQERKLEKPRWRLWEQYNLKWWCQPCADRVGDEMLLDPILVALERQPHLRARLRRLILVEAE